MIFYVFLREEIVKVVNVAGFGLKHSRFLREAHTVFSVALHFVAVYTEFVIGAFGYFDCGQNVARFFVNNTVDGHHIVTYERTEKRYSRKLRAVFARAVYKHVVTHGFNVVTLIAENFRLRNGYRRFYKFIKPENDIFTCGQITFFGKFQGEIHTCRRA